MNFKAQGQITYISPVIDVNPTFKKREFALSFSENGFINTINFQLAGDKMNLVSESLLNKEVEVTFGIKGASKIKDDGTVGLWNNINAFQISVVSKERITQPTPPPPPIPEPIDSLYAPAAINMAPAPIKYQVNADGSLKLDADGRPIVDDLPF